MEAEVLPVEAHATHLYPACRANEAATVIPVSLNEPVGFIPLCLAKSCFTPADLANRGRAYTGVLPSRIVIIWSAAISGKISRNRQTPLWLAGSDDVLRSSQSFLRETAFRPAGPPCSHPGKMISRRSRQCSQRKRSGSALRPQRIHRSCDTDASRLIACSAIDFEKF